MKGAMNMKETARLRMWPTRRRPLMLGSGRSTEVSSSSWTTISGDSGRCRNRRCSPTHGRSQPPWQLDYARVSISPHHASQPSGSAFHPTLAEGELDNHAAFYPCPAPRAQTREESPPHSRPRPPLKGSTLPGLTFPAFQSCLPWVLSYALRPTMARGFLRWAL